MLRERTWTCGASLLTLGLLTTGCPNDDGIGGDAGSSETGDATSTTGDGDDDPGDGDGDDDPGDGDGDGDGDPGDGDGDPGDGDGDGDGEPGDGDGDGDGLPSPLDEIPPEEWVPTDNPDGVPSPLPGVYDDMGAADPNDPFRALIGLDLRNRDDLEDFVIDVSDPLSNVYGQYMTPEEFMTNHAPLEDDFELLHAWLEYEGFSVNYLATSRMLIQFSGTIGQFNAAFNTVMHWCMRKNPQHGQPPIPVYCTSDPMTLPLFVVNRSPGIVTCDLPAEVGQLPNEAGQIMNAPPNGMNTGSRLTPDRVARAYNIDDLHAMGYDGTGQRIGVTVGATIHYKWAQTFWQSMGIVRANPDVINLMEPPVTRYVESQLDVIWPGALAPGADLVVYGGPDARNTSMVFVYNEAIRRAPDDDVWVITNSFAHREDSEPRVVRDAYNDSGLLGAALGITLVSSSGNSARPDTPSGSPWVTAVGGTRLWLNGSGNVTNETAWYRSGSGATKTFDIPPWQVAAAGHIENGDRRVVVDVSAAADTASPYWVYYNSQWSLYGGTSFASPVWSAVVALANDYRVNNGMARIGFMNQMLYTTPAVQATFRDVTAGATDMFAAGPGWDAPTGWGTPNALELALTVPSP